MADDLTHADRREAGHILAEMAADRLFVLINERYEGLAATAGLTQAEIARRMGVAPQLVNKWFREPRNMTVKTAGRLMAAMEAHLLFDLDAFEHMGGNAAAGVVEPIVSSTAIMVYDTAPTVIEQRRAPNTIKVMGVPQNA